MHITFAERLRTARDAGAHPFESWRRKEYAGLPPCAELCFVRPLERLERADWEDILLRGVEAGARYLECIFRTGLMSEADAARMAMRWQESVLAPLQKEGAVGGWFSFPFRSDGTGLVNVALYPLKDIPEESRRSIVAAEAHRRLLELGCTPRVPPKDTLH